MEKFLKKHFKIIIFQLKGKIFFKYLFIVAKTFKTSRAKIRVYIECVVRLVRIT